MPIYRVATICVKLVENNRYIEVLDKKTGIIDKVFKTKNESKYNYYLQKDTHFYSLKLVK